MFYIDVVTTKVVEDNIISITTSQFDVSGGTLENRADQGQLETEYNGFGAVHRLPNSKRKDVLI